MKQVEDFHAEVQALGALLAGLAPEDWDRQTQFKSWTVNDVIVHLHFWNKAADLSLQDPDGFDAFMARALPELQKGGMRAYENAQKRFDLGAINTFELTTAKNNMDTSEVDVVVAKLFVDPAFAFSSCLT